MGPQRIMLLGAAGQIGQAFQHLMEKPGFPRNWEMQLFARQDFDIADPMAVRSTIQSLKPDLIINTAGITNVDYAEKNEEEATKVNFHAVAYLAAQCSALDIPMIHLSTDYVFDGTKGEPYLPDDLMNPINIYGGTKMMGEESLRHELAWHVILRVSWVFSAFRRNLLTNAIHMFGDESKQFDGSMGKELRIASDMMGCPTAAVDVARAIVVIGSQILSGKTDGFGTFHLCGSPPCSRFEMVQAFLEAYNPPQRPNLIEAKSTDFEGFARRPLNTVMDCTKIRNVYGIDQKPWKDGLNEAVSIIARGGRTRI